MCLQSLMKFHHCLFKIVKKNQNVVDKELRRAITLTELAISPYFSSINVHLVDILWMCLPNFMKFHHCLFKILKNQNSHGWTHRQRENSIHPPPATTTNIVCRAGGGGGGGYNKNLMLPF